MYLNGDPGFFRCALHVPDAAFGLGFRYRSREGSPVPPERIERKLAAILAADVAGYSRLMGADEEGTLARLKACRRELMDPEIAEHRGRVVKTTGDGILIEFSSVVDAVRIHGDGVNIAARLESIAEPGGICISDSSYQQVRDKFTVHFEDMGVQQLKNIARPVRVYRVPIGRSAPRERPALALPDKPSIAVLPFQNMSGDPEQEYFADGIVEDIITELSR